MRNTPPTTSGGRSLGVDGGAPGCPYGQLGAERGRDTDSGECDAGDGGDGLIQEWQRG